MTSTQDTHCGNQTIAVRIQTEYLTSFLNETNLVVLNTGQGTRLNAETSTLSVTDLSLVSVPISTKCEWEMHSDMMGSDHFPTVTKIGFVCVCVEVLQPSQPNGVMSSAVSLPNHTFTGQA